LREVPFDSDGAFSWERFEQVYVSELANTWGNLASRAIAMVEKYCGSVVPSAERTEMDRADVDDIAAYRRSMEGRLLHEGLKRAMACVTRGNEFVQTSQPWALAKTPEKRGELERVLASLMRALARQCVLLFPFVPGKARALWTQLGAPGDLADQRLDALDTLDAKEWRVQKGAPLFPRTTETA
jgi:methionyl-tRNA synthetase